MAQAPRDQNRVTALLGTSSVDGVSPVVLWADPTTHRLLVDLPSGAGTVTSVSVVSANGLAGTVATATTTPAITLSTTVTGILSGNGMAISAATTTGSGSVVLATSPTLVTPALGTPSSGVATNLTGTASGLTAGTVTTNANLTGPITSAGNATSIASQTGTGTKFVVDTSPTIVTPTIASFANSNHNHQNSAGGGTLAEAALALTDVTTNNSSTSNHGFLKKLDNVATDYMDGTGNWSVPVGSAISAGTVTTMTPATVAISTAVGTTAISTNTTMNLGMISVNHKIVVNSISLEATAVGTAGTLDLTVYSEDGQTQPIAVTTASIAGTGIVTTAVSAVTLNPGHYYFAANPNGTANVTIRIITASNVALLNPTGEPVMAGTLTITAGTPPATFTNTSITVGTSVPWFRLDN